MSIEDITEIVPEVATITPFQKLVLSIGEIPTNYLDSMSYAEQVTWFCMFLQEKVLPVVNQHSEKILEIINYLNNLDLQDEVNNKLDEMAESGELDQIIQQYLNSSALWCFDTVAEMKEATNLINGSYTKTLGYYSINDDGGATYKVREITNADVIDEQFIIALNNENLVAEIVCEDLNVKQLGCYGDNSHDDTDKIQNIIDYASSTNKRNIIFPKGTYLTNKPLILYNFVHIIGNSATIKKTTNTTDTTYNKDSIIILEKNEGYQYNYCNGQIIENISLIGNESNTYAIYSSLAVPYTRIYKVVIDKVINGIYFLHGGWLFEISKCIITPTTDGIDILDNSTTLKMYNNYVTAGSGNGYYLSGVSYSDISNIACDYVTGVAYRIAFCNLVINGLGCESPDSTKFLVVTNSNIEINNGKVYTNADASYVCIDGTGSSAIFNNINFYDNTNNEAIAGKFISSGNNFYPTFNNCIINKKFTTANSNSALYNIQFVKDKSGNYNIQPYSDFPGLGIVQDIYSYDAFDNNSNIGNHMGGIFFNNYGSIKNGYNKDRSWHRVKQLGDIFINQAPEKNGIALFQQLSDYKNHDFASPITAVTVNGTNATITLNNFTLDEDGTKKGCQIREYYKITSSSGGAGYITSIDKTTHTIVLHDVTGTFAVDDTIKLIGRTDIRDMRQGNIQFIGYGKTVYRPESPAYGYMYFDSTLGKPIWWTGSKWVDSTGTEVQ